MTGEFAGAMFDQGDRPDMIWNALDHHWPVDETVHQVAAKVITDMGRDPERMAKAVAALYRWHAEKGHDAATTEYWIAHDIDRHWPGFGTRIVGRIRTLLSVEPE